MDVLRRLDARAVDPEAQSKQRAEVVFTCVTLFMFTEKSATRAGSILSRIIDNVD